MIEPKEVREFSERHALEKFYLLDAPGAPDFCFVYVGTDVCTLGWQGALKFSLVDHAALVDIPTMLQRAHNLPSIHLPEEKDPQNVQSKVQASIIDSAHELSEFDLNQFDERNRYGQMIVDPSTAFARYDVTLQSDQLPIAYAFTAENPHWTPNQSSELTILLPKDERWSEQLLEWVLAHHKFADAIREHIALDNFASVLAEITRSDVLYT